MFSIGVSVLLFVVLYAFLQEVKTNDKIIFLEDLTLMPTFSISLQSPMSDVFPFPRLFLKLPISHFPFIVLLS